MKTGGIGYYNDDYRNQCLLCWSEQIGADINEMAVAADKVNQKNQYSVSFLPSTIECVKSFNYAYDNQKDLYREAALLVLAADSIIEPVFGKGILKFSSDEIILYNSLTRYDRNSNLIPIIITAE